MGSIEAESGLLPFGAFKEKSLNRAIVTMTNFRGKHSQIRDYNPLIAQKDYQTGNIKADPMDQLYFKDPDGSARHYNIFIKESLPASISAGSVGRYKFCIEGNPPRLELRYGILNIKDGSGYKFYDLY
jgi:hypothetical protein